jgi:hypothetical protein
MCFFIVLRIRVVRGFIPPLPSARQSHADAARKVAAIPGSADVLPRDLVGLDGRSAWRDQCPGRHSTMVFARGKRSWRSATEATEIANDHKSTIAPRRHARRPCRLAAEHDSERCPHGNIGSLKDVTARVRRSHTQVKPPRSRQWRFFTHWLGIPDGIEPSSRNLRFFGRKSKKSISVTEFVLW